MFSYWNYVSYYFLWSISPSENLQAYSQQKKELGWKNTEPI